MAIRSRIRRLVLINWHGMFYQPFEFANGITGLEGPNGAGKSTTMIGVFVVLLPDQGLLSFRAVGDTGGDSDRGVYGRLGKQGPAYSFLEFEMPTGERVWGGVLLSRGPEPKLELTPMLIEGLTPDVVLEEVFLTVNEGQEFAPALSELKEQVVMHGGVVRSMESVGAYLSALFDRGILPLPLTKREERERFHRVLQTSMVGGLSSFIQKGLRDYLMAEDTHLRSYVGRMRDNLEACRVTRRQIGDAKQRYETIRSVYGAAWGMVEGAFHGTRLRGKNVRDAVAKLIESLREKRTEVMAAKEALTAAKSEHERLTQEQILKGQELADAQAQSEKVDRAVALAAKVRHVGKEMHEAVVALDKAKAKLDRVKVASEGSYASYCKAQEERERIARELADAQVAFEGLHARVAAYRAAAKCLEEVRKALPKHTVSADTAGELSQKCETFWHAALIAKVDAERAFAEFDVRKKRYDEVYAALLALAEKKINPSDAFDAACCWDNYCRGVEDRIARAKDLPNQIREAEDIFRKQTTARERGALLGVMSFAGYAAALEEAQASEAETNAKIVVLTDTLETTNGRLASARNSIAGLEAQLALWELAADLAGKLSGHFNVPTLDEAQLSRLARQLKERIDAAMQAHHQHLVQARSYDQAASQLDYGGGHVQESLVSLADAVDGHLLLEQYDETPEKDAAQIEARLGPLTGALIVENPVAAATAACDVAARPDTVWFVSPDRLPIDVVGKSLGDSELIEDDGLVRLTRHPKFPVVGREAREREIDRLCNLAESERKYAERELSSASELVPLHDIALQLKPVVDWIGKPSPNVEIERLRREVRKLEGEIGVILKNRADEKARLQLVTLRTRELSALAPFATLLDPPEWGQNLEQLREESEQVAELREWLSRQRKHWDIVQEGCLELRNPPNLVKKRSLEKKTREATETLRYWGRGRELLGDLVDRLPAFEYASEVPLLERENGFLLTLQKESAAVGKRVAAAKAALDKAQGRLQTAREAYNECDAALGGTSQQLRRYQQELQQTGYSGTEEETRQARTRVSAARVNLEKTEQAERAAHESEWAAGRRIDDGYKAVLACEDELRKQLKDARPNWAHWVKLKGAARRAGVWEKLMAPMNKYRFDVDGNPITAFRAGSESMAVLKKILENVEGGRALLSQIEPFMAGVDDVKRAAQNLRAWADVREYLEQRIPREIAQADEPELALVQIHDHLTVLEARLADQELALRQRTEEVANSIASKVRREEQRINQINKRLELVHFGSIQGVKLKSHRNPTHEALLAAMRESPDLLSSDVPLEQAMSDLFEQVGGGRIKGEKLLDYREYLRLTVQVKRMGQDAWGEARPNSLSTGESIGIGASILIVILDAWEQQAVLLRGRIATGSLHFLLLDEANRLDGNALDTLTDFCERMGVQLLAAAPELGRARRGNVYSLVRLDRNGEVVVRGRRWL